MLHEKHGNVLEETTGIIVHGCNAQGVYNKGIAKQIRELYPKCYTSYITNVNFYKELYPDDFSDRLLGTISSVSINKNLLIVNAIIQKHYGNDKSIVYVDYDAISTVFKKLSHYAGNYRLQLKFPKIGSGLANGDWNKISSIINNELGSLDSTVFYL